MSLAVLAATFAAGLVVQRLYARPWVLRATWGIYFWTVTPALVFYSFSTVAFDGELTLALAAAVLAGWIVIGIAVAYAHGVSHDPAERGTLALAAGFGNTGFVGYPLAQLMYGTDGLALMVVYDRIGLVVPGLAVTTAIARYYGRRSADAEARGWWIDAFANPLIAAMALAVLVRATGAQVPGIEVLADVGGAIVGPVGFFLLGLSLPLEPVAHRVHELLRAAGALAIRFGVSPLVLVGCGLALGADVPGVFVLAAALPCPFHLLILARVFDLRPALMRLLVVGSTIPAIVIVAGIALF